MDNFDMAVAVKNNDAISRKAVFLITAETGALETQRRVMELPALDVAPVVHAHWVKTFGSDGFVSTLRCSKCGNAKNSNYSPGNFCWFCGARMDGEAE